MLSTSHSADARLALSAPHGELRDVYMVTMMMVMTMPALVTIATAIMITIQEAREATAFALMLLTASTPVTVNSMCNIVCYPDRKHCHNNIQIEQILLVAYATCVQLCGKSRLMLQIAAAWRMHFGASQQILLSLKRKRSMSR